jgi:hypothetical protein
VEFDVERPVRRYPLVVVHCAAGVDDISELIGLGCRVDDDVAVIGHDAPQVPDRIVVAELDQAPLVQAAFGFIAMLNDRGLRRLVPVRCPTVR